MKKEYILVIVFSILIFFFTGYNILGENSSKSIDEAESKVIEKESRYDELLDNLTELNNAKDDLNTYMLKLKESYNLFSETLKSLDKEIQTKQSEIDAINESIKKSEEVRLLQYDAMKKRIKYMYEASDNDYSKVFLSDMSISDILNQAEYISKLIEYDRTKLSEYEALLVSIEKSKDSLEKEMDSLLVLKKEEKEKANELAILMKTASENISKKESEIDKAEAEAADYAKLLDEEKNSLIELKEEESKRIEESIKASIEASKKEAEGIVEEATTAAPYNASEDDLSKLAAIIYCEARGESYEGMLAVGSVVMNRVNDTRFPNTIEAVIMSPGQFSPVASGLYAIALAKGSNEVCIQAAKEVLYDGVRIGPWLYFRTVNNIIQGTVIGNHVFYYR